MILAQIVLFCVVAFLPAIAIPAWNWYRGRGFGLRAGHVMETDEDGNEREVYREGPWLWIIGWMVLTLTIGEFGVFAFFFG